MNILKLLLLNDDIISSKNYLINKLYNIKSIFIKANEDDIFSFKLISEEISKNIIEESETYFGNTFIEDKKYSIDYIHSSDEIFSFYNSISTNLKIYEINNGNFDDLENYKMNYSILRGLKTLENMKSYMILKKSSGPFFYEKYVNNMMIDLNYNLEISKICYLLMDFEYHFTYNKKVNKILIKLLNNDNEYKP